MKSILLLILVFLSELNEPKNDLKFWCRMNFEINSNRLISNDSINKYFSFYKKDVKMNLENKITIDLLSVD